MIHPEAVEALLLQAQQGVEEGGLPSCQIALGYEGEVVVSRTFGAAEDDTRYVTFSVSKAVTAGAVWLLVGEGRLDYAARVADLVPEFASNGKDAITVEQLLLHTAGIPRAPMSPEAATTSAGRLKRFARWRLDWEPGSRCEYHPSSAHWVLGELIERISGQRAATFVAERIAEPLGLRSMVLGEPADARVAELAVVGEPLPAAVLEQMTEAARAALNETVQQRLLRFNDPAVRAVASPGAGVVATAADIAAYYQSLLHNPNGLWDDAVLADGTRAVRNTLPDAATRAPANRTRGLVVAGDDGLASLRGFGPKVGAGAFGSTGVAGQFAWADPATGVSVCYLTNGLEANPVSWLRRSMRLSDLASACVASLRSASST